MSKIKVLVVQNSPTIDKKKQNLIDVKTLLKVCEGKSYDLIVFPELFLVGWYPDAFIQNAETLDNSPTLDFLKQVSTKFNANVIGGSYIFKDDTGKYRNACPIINRAGELLAHYYKMHLFTHFIYSENKNLTAGDKGLLVNFDFGKVGISICYDIRFAELFRTYAYGGADLLVEVAAWPKSRLDHWLTLNKARAIENQTYMIATSQTGYIIDDEYNLGHSLCIAPYGEIIAEGDEQACVFDFEIDFDAQNQLRKTFSILKDRHTLPYTFEEI